MAEYNCAACEEIRQKDPNLIVNGFGDTECNYLKNDTGIDGSSDDCTDLGLLNDCLVGNMQDEIDSYDVCDWKDYMKKFVPNVWTVFKAIICAICGIWTNIHNLWSNIEKLSCYIDKLSKGTSFKIGESPTDNSYVVAGKGISFYSIDPDTATHSSDISLTYIAGGLLIGSGSLAWHTSNFTDASECVNFDNGSTERTSTSRLGNSYWGETGRHANNGELIYEIRIKRSAYPQLGYIAGGFGIETGGSAYRFAISVFEAGQYAYGQHGGCNRETGTPDDDGYSSGHRVPTGWVYLQARMTWQDAVMGDGRKYTPRYWSGVRMNLSEFDC